MCDIEKNDSKIKSLIEDCFASKKSIEKQAEIINSSLKSEEFNFISQMSSELKNMDLYSLFWKSFKFLSENPTDFDCDMKMEDIVDVIDGFAIGF